MAVTSCKLVSGRSMRITPGKNEYRMKYKIQAAKDDYQPEVLRGARANGMAHPLPRTGDVFDYGGSTDNTAICTEIELNQDNEADTGFWFADVTFGQPNDGATVLDEDPNPLDRPAKWGLRMMTEMLPIAKDKDGTPLRNAAGDEFIDPLMAEIPYPVLYASKNVASLQTLIDWNLEYSTAVNSVTFKGGTARKVRCLPIEVGDQQQENNVLFYPAVFQFAYNDKTWDEEIVNQGFYTKNGTNRTRITDADGSPVATPALLTADGTGTVNQGAIGNTVTKRWRPEKDLNKLVREAKLS